MKIKKREPQLAEFLTHKHKNMNEVLEKINQDIFERSMKHNFKELPKTGYFSQEFEYRKCKTGMQGLDNYYFIVSKKLEYHNGSMTNYKYVVYAYDKNGNYVSDQSGYEKCRGKFFKSLEDI